jgi:hypothetical protein
VLVTTPIVHNDPTSTGFATDLVDNDTRAHHAFMIGVGTALWFRARDAERYAAVGRFVHENA